MKKNRFRRHHRPRLHRAFTLAELIIAGLIATIVLGSVSTSLGQLARVKSLGKIRFSAYSRADAAISELRRDVASVIRTDDLFFTRFLLYDQSVRTPVGEIDRDELLIFTTRLRPIRELDRYKGEGLEYETQYRIEEDDFGPVLWQRRDMMPDEFPAAGGVATPLVEGIIGLEIEAYDGNVWFEEWDSDIHGLPEAVRITIYASGHQGEDDAYERTPIALRTIVPIDRFPPPRDIFEAEEEELRALEPEPGTEGAGEDGSGVPGDANGGPPNLNDLPGNGGDINPDQLPGGPPDGGGGGGGRGGRGGSGPTGTQNPGGGTGGGSDTPTLGGSQGGGDPN